MTTNLAYSQIRDRRPAAIRASLVADYKRAHAEMLAAITAMEALASGAPPTQLRLSHMRLKITRAAGDSRAAFTKIVTALSPQQPPVVARRLQSVEELHDQLRDAARRHMSTWTHAHAQQDWEGYYRSGAHVRQLWREGIQKERELIYPLLFTH